ncbi:MAG: 2,3-bisphosphoglycerate-independent phosphoglycerate mutase, partial [Oscillospiraceae bacterium]|nr:2,3-bisphosphoglycerate-independent phosphoglycerate mutase [Oscillospiraceae bacterium]
RIRSGLYDVVIVNFANCDMVGHTGVFDAVVSAVSTVDACVGKVVAATEELGGTAIITADHGNAEQMQEPNGSPHTAHTLNPVPFIIRGADVKLREGRLCDIVPTMLDLMGLEKPSEMSGESLII